MPAPNLILRRLPGTLLTAALLVLAGCALPTAPPYPYHGPYGTREGVIAEAERQSRALEQYVKDVLDGKQPSEIPEKLLPVGREKELKNQKWYVQRESEIVPARQWILRERSGVDFAASPGAYPDLNCTYLLLPHFLPPFGNKVLIEGDFPHARFFNLQFTPAFQPEQYHYGGTYGVGENVIVDADIVPQPGSLNPYRVGASRKATARAYRVTLLSLVGNSAKLDPAYKPGYRAPGDTRTTSGLVYEGPWGDPDYQKRQKNFDRSPLISRDGLWDAGDLWVRIYAPDRGTDALGGVAVPKVTYQLPDGRRYFIATDLDAYSRMLNKRVPVPAGKPKEPDVLTGSNVGWRKMWGIVRSGVVGIAYALKGPDFNDKAYIRAVDKGGNGRDEDLPAPHNYESSQTLCTHNHYLQRGMSLGQGRVVVITGRLPTTPATRNGEPVMKAAQLRYFSLHTYDSSLIPKGGPVGIPVQSLMDDEIITDAKGYFTIVFSRPEDRPANATAENGVTWRDWGPPGEAMIMLRYLAVGPEWTFPQAPTENNLGRTSDWASPSYNESLLGKNIRTGWMGDYLPNLHYLSKPEFEKLGRNTRWNQIPVWR